MKRSASALLLLAVAMLVAAPSYATVIHFSAQLDGASEFPSNASPGMGLAVVVLDTDAHTLSVHVDFADLIGTTTASHIHCCVEPTAAIPTAGVATTTPTFTGFPLGVTSGTYDHVFDLTLASSFNPAFVTAHGDIAGAEAALTAGLEAGDAYLNIHTDFVPSGEIRGFLAVPEPGVIGLLALAIGAVFVTTRRRTLH